MVKLTKKQKDALTTLAMWPNMKRTSFSDRTWLSLCDKGLCKPRGCFVYAEIPPVITEAGIQAARQIAKAKIQH